MKRSMDDETTEESEKRFKSTDPFEYPSREMETEILKETSKKFLQVSSDSYESQIADATMKYYISFFKKTLKELPFCEHVFGDLVGEIGDDKESFYKAFSVAKTCINCNLQIKKYVAFEAVFSVASGAIGRAVHHRYVEPLLIHLMDGKHLRKAFATYQSVLNNEEQPNDLQCVAYLIQTELEKREPCKVPNPLLNAITKQVTAVSKYLICLLQSVANEGFDEE